MFVDDIKLLREKTWSCRQRFGQLTGLIFWNQLKNKIMQTAPNEIFRLKVPGFSNPILLRAGTSDIETFHQVITNREADIPLSFQPQFIVDAGANIGLTAICYAIRFPKAKIIAIEMEASNYDLLVENTKYYPNIECIRKALWHEQTNLSITNPDADAWAFQVGKSLDKARNLIPTITPEELLKLSPGYHIDLLKLDIEGAEVDLLGGQQSRWIGHISAIAIELHDRFRPGCSEALGIAINGKVKSLVEHGEYKVIELQNDTPIIRNVGPYR